MWLERWQIGEARLGSLLCWNERSPAIVRLVPIRIVAVRLNAVLQQEGRERDCSGFLCTSRPFQVCRAPGPASDPTAQDSVGRTLLTTGRGLCLFFLLDPGPA